MKKMFFLLVSILSLFLAACGSRPSGESNKENSAAIVRVKAAPVSLADTQSLAKTPGTIRSSIQAPLASKVMGSILEVRVHAGDPVKAGQIVAIIDGREIKAMVQKSSAGVEESEQALQEIDKGIEAAQANLDLANSTLKRYQSLAASKSISPQEFDEVSARQKGAAASVESLRAKRQQVLSRISQAQSDQASARALESYIELRSPLNGVVVQRNAEPGSLAVPGVPLVVVEAAGSFRLEVPLEESRIGAVRIGQKVGVEVPALESPRMEGTVSEIQPASDPMSRTYLVKINLPVQKALRSGLYGEAYFPGASRQGIWVPSSAVVHQGQMDGVYVIEKGQTARLRFVKVGQSEGDKVEILSGLEAGESLVSAPASGVGDGSRVEVEG